MAKSALEIYGNDNHITIGCSYPILYVYDKVKINNGENKIDIGNNIFAITYLYNELCKTSIECKNGDSKITINYSGNSNSMYVYMIRSIVDLETQATFGLQLFDEHGNLTFSSDEYFCHLIKANTGIENINDESMALIIPFIQSSSGNKYYKLELPSLKMKYWIAYKGAYGDGYTYSLNGRCSSIKLYG